MIKTKVTELLGTKYPLIQGALGEVSESVEFVATVCNAGALGVLAAVHLGADGVKEDIHRIRDLTDKPFGVNILPVNPYYDKIIDVCVEENVPVICHGRYNPVKTIIKAKGSKTLAIPSVGSVKHAIQAEQDGADAIIVTGTEAGGHTGYVGTIVLIPAVLRKVKIPVIAGGGIVTPEQVAAMFVLGAEGVDMGTRFMMTKESPLHPNALKALLDATEEDTYATVHASGRHQRWLATPAFRKRFVGLPDTKGKDHYWSFPPFAGKGAIEGDLEKGWVATGQGIGLINDIPSIKEMVESIMTETEKVLREKAKLVA
ncbi:MAG TPA: enoyl-[acyl-carrier-protein] reductase FabK [Deltaproteobacteria bacterium]|nr:enoyl-[acyl-carrier-protein] reductase FabK [Deltaproteobacteria bacterium]